MKELKFWALILGLTAAIALIGLAASPSRAGVAQMGKRLARPTTPTPAPK